MEKPLVSVLVPTFNQEAYILQTLNSINMQEIDFLIEVLIGDDASTDATGTICSDYNFSNKCILKRYIRHEHNLGVIGNWKYLLSIAKGKYLAVCEGDDYWTDAHKLKLQVEVLEKNHEIAICFHRARYIDGETGKFISLSPITNVATITDGVNLSQTNYITNLTVICRNFSKKGNYPDWVFSESLPVPDYLWHMYNAQFGNIYFLPNVMADYRVHSKSLWSSLDSIKKNELVLEKLLVPLKINLHSKEIEDGLKRQALNIFYDTLISQGLSPKVHPISKATANFVNNEFLLSFMAGKILKLKRENEEIYKSRRFKIGSFIINMLSLNGLVKWEKCSQMPWK